MRGRIKTAAIPLAWPSYVAVSDRYAYVADTINRRVVRVRLSYAAEAETKFFGKLGNVCVSHMECVKRGV